MNRQRFLTMSSSWVLLIVLVLGMVAPAQVLAAPDAPAPEVSIQAVTVEGTPTVQTAASGTSVSFAHTSGTGTDRLLMVGVSWNSNTAAATINSVTFTSASGVLDLSQAILRKNSTAFRYASIWYSPTEPPNGEAGTVAVTFSANVASGIIVGAANFAGVDTTTPLGAASGADGTGTALSVTLTGLAGDELVFDTVFMGGTSPTVTVDPSQTQQWTGTAGNARGAGSTEQAAGSSVTMSWTGGASGPWVDVAVPMYPACTAGRYTLVAGNDGHGTVTLFPSGGSYCSGRSVTLTPVPNTGYMFSGWVGEDADDISGSGPYTIVMDEDKSITANFVPQACSDVSLNAAEDTYLSAASTAIQTYNYGATTSLQVDGTTGTSRRTALLRWNTNSIPANAVVSSATVVLQVSNTSAIAYPLYDVAKAWVEGNLDGVASSAGDPGANWGYWDYESGSAWGTAGASSTTGSVDRGTTNLWNSTTSSFNATGSRSVALNADGVAIVQRWVAGGVNNGVIIQQYSGTTNNLIFDSSEGAVPPAMTITYCLPNNTAPSQPTLVAPTNGATGVSTSPTLDVTVSDTDGNALDVRFYGRQVGAGSIQKVGEVYAVASGSNATMVWPGLAPLTQYEWNVNLYDGNSLTGSSFWTFTTAGAEEMDFGDAPDLQYQTLLASNGARHVLGPPIFLGAVVDAEADGQPSPLADGDDLNPVGQPDDEDGVTFVQPFLNPGDPAAPIAVVVGPGAPGPVLLDAWIDFNGNTVFDHPLEHLWGASIPVVPGPNPLTFAVPVNAVLGPTYARFRLSTLGGLPPFGLAPDGEVEDYRIHIGPTTGTIIVEKQTDPHWVDTFTFTGDAAGTIGDDEQIVVGGLAPGPYQSIETGRPYWVLTAITCDDTNSTGDLLNRTANFQLEAGETVKCTFTNRAYLDYGDAPDSYGTLAASDGARHWPGPDWMGLNPDTEADGQPTPLADGDDNNPVGQPDDEDGVTLPAALAAGSTVQITVDGGPNGGTAGKLDAWIDFNRDNDFDHPAEHLWGGTSQALQYGQQQVTFDVPADAEVGTTYARFRLSIAGNLPPTGYAPDGEVEDYTVEIVGAPVCYALTVGKNGNGTTPTASPTNSTGCPSGQYVSGENISLSGATPDTGWAITGWYGTDDDPSTASTNSLVMPASARSAGVNYGRSCYALTLGHSGNGTTPVASSSAFCSAGYYAYGETINLSGATPDTGWAITGWYGTDDDPSTASTNSLVMPASARSAGVNYARSCYALTLGHTGNGTTPAASSSAVCSAGYYAYGETINLSGATPDAGWGIASWYGTSDDNSTANTNSLTMPAGAHSAGVNYLRLLGDVNLDGDVDSTDALIVLTVDAGLPAAAYCPMNYGDVNDDGLANSTDALIILTYDVGLPVGTFPVGQPVPEPTLTAQPPGCNLGPGSASRWSLLRGR